MDLKLIKTILKKNYIKNLIINKFKKILLFI